MNEIIEDNNNNQRKELKSKEDCKPKWAKLKKYLQDKVSYESSVQLLKTKTIEQFTSKCCEIYKEKIQIHLMRANNKQIFLSWVKNKEKDISNYLPSIEVKKDLSDLCYDSSIQDFLFYFRENNEFMLNLIKNVSKEKRKIIVPFLCHFFYENFFMETQEQEEILYLIYLLLEKEIDGIFSPSPLSFLENSFLGDFLSEMANKYEISNYIDNILNTLIRDVEEHNSFYNSLDIIENSNDHYKYNRTENCFIDMACQNENCSSKTDENKFQKNKNNKMSLFEMESTPVNKSFKKRKTTMIKPIMNNNFSGNSKLANLTLVNNIKYVDMNFKNLINKNIFDNINENYLKKLLENEKDEIMKSFYIKQIKILNMNHNPNFFSTKSFYEKIKKIYLISKLSIEQFNKSIEIATTFIDNLLSNLENKIIIPYNIKAICKFIDILIKQKFKNISKIQCNSFICRFLFDKLILPVLENPDINNSAKNMILSLNTRKNLTYVYEVLKNLIRGELFNCDKNEKYTVFNKFIIQNYFRINNIIQNILYVRIPEKLFFLSQQFYDDENFSLENVIRDKNDINYNYFDENPYDFMLHKSICFNINHFLLFYGTVHLNKEWFIEKDKDFEKILEKVSSFIASMDCSISHHYVIIKEEYNEEIKELLLLKDKKIKLIKPKNEEESLFKLKHCIIHLFSSLQIMNYWNYLNENYDTKQTFELLHKYLTFYGEKVFPPLIWYTQFILNNLNLINQKYINNDYQLLYNEIENDIKFSIKKLKKLNEFLTVNMTTKFFLIENRKKNFKNELENVKRTELNIKALLFIELIEIKVCLMKGIDYKRFMFSDEKTINNDSLILCKQKNCPHSNIMKTFIRTQQKCHCKNVKEFAENFSNYHEFISKEIINYSFGQDFYNSKIHLFSDFNNDKLNNKNIIITDSPKKILEGYMNFISRKINENILFNSFQRNGFEIITDQKEDNNLDIALNLQKEKNNREKATYIIWNYILKTLCNKIYESNVLFVDQIFNLRCLNLKFVEPNNLKIPKEIVNDQILNKIKNHIKRIDELRTPGEMIEEFGTVVQLINLLYKFFLNQDNTEAGDLLPIIIYCIISACPKRIKFNINFSKFFLSEKELLGGIGYNMIQAESSINFIEKLEAEQIGLSQEEFNKKLSNA